MSDCFHRLTQLVFYLQSSSFSIPSRIYSLYLVGLGLDKSCPFLLMEKERREKVDKEIGDSSRRKRKRVRDTLSDDEDVKGDLGEDLDSHQMRKEEHEDDVEEIKREVKERYARSDFVNGDAVIVVSGDFIGLEGWIERVDDDGIFHIKPNRKDLSVINFITFS